MGTLAAPGHGARETHRRGAASGERALAREQARSLTVVVDAAALVDATLGRGREEWSRLVAALGRAGRPLVAPELLWSEGVSVLHELAWRGRLEREAAEEALALFLDAPVERRRPRGLRERAWQIADRLGWAKTYDAEYCALAELLRCELATTDGRLRAAGARLGYVFTPDEVAERVRAG